MGQHDTNLRISQDTIKEFSLVVDENGFEKACMLWDGKAQKNFKNKPTLARFDQDWLLEFLISILFAKQQLPLDCQRIQLTSPSIGDEMILMNINNGSKYFSLENYKTSTLFEKISVPNIITLIQAILQEKQIIIVSDDRMDLINICESLINLIFPIQWIHPYLPVLPQNLYSQLTSLTPYICGLLRSEKNGVLEKWGSQVVVLDVEEDTIETQMQQNIPFKLQQYLQSGLSGCVGRKTHFTQENQMNIKRIMFNFFWGLVNNLTPFFLYSEMSEKEVRCAKAKEIFDFDDYLRIFKDEIPFMKELTSKSGFRVFIEDCFKILYKTEYKKAEFVPQLSYDHKLVFFLDFTKKINQKISKKTLYVDIMTSPQFLNLEVQNKIEIKKQLESIQNLHKIDLTSYVIKYIVYMQKNNKETPTPQDQSHIIIKKLQRNRFQPMKFLNPEIQKKTVPKSPQHPPKQMEISFAKNNRDNYIQSDQTDENAFVPQPLISIFKVELEYDDHQHRQFVYEFEKKAFKFPRTSSRQYNIQNKTEASITSINHMQNNTTINHLQNNTIDPIISRHHLIDHIISRHHIQNNIIDPRLSRLSDISQIYSETDQIQVTNDKSIIELGLNEQSVIEQLTIFNTVLEQRDSYQGKYSYRGGSKYSSPGRNQIFKFNDKSTVRKLVNDCTISEVRMSKSQESQRIFSQLKSTKNSFQILNISQQSNKSKSRKSIFEKDCKHVPVNSIFLGESSRQSRNKDKSMDYQQFKNSSHSVKKNVINLDLLQIQLENTKREVSQDLYKSAGKENLIQIFKKNKQQGFKKRSTVDKSPLPVLKKPTAFQPQKFNSKNTLQQKKINKKIL